MSIRELASMSLQETTSFFEQPSSHFPDMLAEVQVSHTRTRTHRRWRLICLVVEQQLFGPEENDEDDPLTHEAEPHQFILTESLFEVGRCYQVARWHSVLPRISLR
jgi:hypothetical protein